jgi:protease-4
MRDLIQLIRSIIVACALLLFAGGCGFPSFLITPVQNTSKLEEQTVKEGSGWSQPKIAMIEVEGMLINARAGGFLQPGENKLSLFTQQLERAEKDEAVKAVVLRINSPGGTVTCTDTMYQDLVKFRQKTHKPVIASTQEICASGGYYVACGSDQIVAHPTSVVGSIGVIFETFDASEGLDKLGIKSEAIKSGPLKDMGSPFRPLDSDARAVMQGMVNEYYARFLSVVKDNRKQLAESDHVKLATDGRVFSGEQALKLGLVDRIGLLDDAIDLAKQMSKSPGAKVVMYKRPYGYSGSIYAETSAPAPQSNVMTLQLPESAMFLPSGFYYLWRP